MSLTMVEAAEAIQPPADHEGYLPSPPNDTEKYQYYGPQRRWIFMVFFAAFAGIMYGLSRLALNSMWTSLLYELMAVQIVAVLISLVSSTRRRRSTCAEHMTKVIAYRPEHYPAVDVFLPSAGEPLSILRNTYRHVARLQWPGRLMVYVLDDSARPEVAALAQEYGLIYLSRPNRGELKKAGNLRYGFEHSTGDFIQVLDADFVPRPDMTSELMPYFDDPGVGIVQSPQYFDVTDARLNWLQLAAGATQELFYRWVQPARDAVDAAICVGTDAIYRRAALVAAGGFARIGHSEDVHTGVNLAKAGFVTRYVPVNLAKGVCPDNVDGFANQQYRWCTGSMSLLADPEFHRSSLSIKQKLCFWTGFLYYITTSIAAFTIPIPGLLMLYFFPEQIRPVNYLPMLGTVFVWSTLMPRVTHHRWTPAVLRVQLLIGYCHAVALYDFARKRTAAWVPTGTAKRNATARRVLLTLRVWLSSTLLLHWIGIAWVAYQFGPGRLWATVIFSGPMLYMALPLIWPRLARRPRLPRRSSASVAPRSPEVGLHADHRVKES
jgi:cellulose synthase (UDP-forming)